MQVKGLSPGGSTRNPGVVMPQYLAKLIQASGLQECKLLSLCCFQLYELCGNLIQQTQEANTATLDCVAEKKSLGLTCAWMSTGLR